MNDALPSQVSIQKPSNFVLFIFVLQNTRKQTDSKVSRWALLIIIIVFFFNDCNLELRIQSNLYLQTRLCH